MERAVTHLHLSTLGDLPPWVSTPSYVPWKVQVGIVHFGVGVFHRSHEAMYIDRILTAGDTRWGICGVGVLPEDRTIGDVLLEQDHLYTLVTVAPDGTAQARVVGAITEYLYGPDNPAAVQAKLADSRTKIVSLTITEGGYSMDDATGVFDPTGLTLADLQPMSGQPCSVLGHIVAGLDARRGAGAGPFTVLSCDNMVGNGDTARSAVLAFAQRKDPALASWINEYVSFPNSMVDRITPATTDHTRQAVETDFGIEDAWPVRAESFEQWVIEDKFCAGRPDLHTVGVQLVADVKPYELMKLRLLNASHQVMSYLGLLSGYTQVHEVCRDPGFARFLLGYMHEEAIPTLQPVPGIDLEVYCDQLITRFCSAAIADTLSRQATDGSDRLPRFLLPVVADQLLHGRPITRSALTLAAWSLFLDGATDTPPVDRRLPSLKATAEAERDTPGAFLTCSPVFGALGNHPVLRTAFVQARAAITAGGAQSAIRGLGIAGAA